MSAIMPEASFPGVSEDFTHMLVFEPVARSGQRMSGEGNSCCRPYAHDADSRVGTHRNPTRRGRANTGSRPVAPRVLRMFRPWPGRL